MRLKIIVSGLLGLVLLMQAEVDAEAQTLALEPVAADAVAAPPIASHADGEWVFQSSVYMWMASMGGESSQGQNIDIEFSDLVKDLNGAVMGNFGARHGKWSFMVDVIYIGVDDSDDQPLSKRVTFKNLDMSAWIVTPAVGYNVVQNEALELDLMAGARYVYLSTDVEFQGPFKERMLSESGDAWNGIVGLRGKFLLSEKWSLPFYVDAGTGDTKFTWQAYAGLG